MPQPETAAATPLPNRGLLVAAVAVGVVYGLLFRIVFGFERFERVFGVMTVAFLFFVPAAFGYLTVAIGERRGPWSWTARLFAPPATALLALFAALVLAWEGLICIVLWLPLTVVMAVIGALLAVIVGTLGTPPECPDLNCLPRRAAPARRRARRAPRHLAR